MHIFEVGDYVGRGSDCQYGPANFVGIVVGITKPSPSRLVVSVKWLSGRFIGATLRYGTPDSELIPINKQEAEERIAMYVLAE